MSNLGATQTFGAHLSRDGKPLIMWDTGPPEESKKKQFGYKAKSVRYPLRSKQNTEEPPPTQPTKPPAVKPQQRPPKPIQNGSTNKNSKKETQKTARPKSHSKDMVTLTQAQFDHILETIGELSLYADTNIENKTTGSVDLDAPLPEIPPAPSTLPTSANQRVSSGVPNLAISQAQPTTSSQQVPGLDISSPRYPDPRSIPTGPVAGNVRPSVVGIPWKHLTQVERKRVEWERQKAEEDERKRQVSHTQNLHHPGGTSQQQGTPQPNLTLQTQAGANPSRQNQVEPFILPHVKARLEQEALRAAQLQNTSNAQQTSQLTLPRTSQPSTVPGLRSQPVNVPGLSNQPSNIPALSNQPSNITGLTNQPANVPGLSNQPANVPGVTNQLATVPGLRYQQANVPVLSNPNQVNFMPSQASAPVAVVKPLTKAEQKRRQWEKERAALKNSQEWDPWGRPGAGAPIRDGTGQILADYSTRKPDQNEMSQYSGVVQNDVARFPVEDHRVAQQYTTTGAQPQYTAAVQAQHLLPGQPNPGHMADEPPPAAIRSSFTVGAAAPNEDKYTSAKEKQRREWLADLEKQREEQRQRKLNEHQKDMAYFADDSSKTHQYNYDYKQAAVPSQVAAPSTVPQQPAVHQPAVYQPSGNTMPPAAATDATDTTDTFIRGQNAYIDPKTRLEKEEIRKKEVEHQDYIKQQIGDRQNDKRRERERRWQEEAAEEAKLQAERQKLQNQHDAEQQRILNKKEAEERKQTVLKQAMEAEKERAEWEKHERRMLKLRKGGHDISNYHASFEAKHTPRDGASSVITAAPTHIPGLPAPTMRDHAPSVLTSFPSPTPLPPDDYTDTRSKAKTVGRHDPYTENRTLTPSVFRPAQNAAYDSNVREFGVQADMGPGISRESTDIEYAGPIQRKKKVRVKSATEVKAAKKSALKHSTYTVGNVARSAPPNREYELEVEQEQQIVTKRPAWGYQNPKQKQKIAQSERDPFYSERKARRDAMKARRKRTLETIANQNAPTVAGKTTAAVRARSRDQGAQNVKEDNFTHPSSVHVMSQNKLTGEEKRPIKARSQSPAVPGLHNFATVESRADTHSNASHHKGYSTRSRSRSPGAKRNTARRDNSPPVPALKHRDYNPDNYGYDTYRRQDLGSHSNIDANRTKYGDRDPIGAPVSEGEFVPFIRSTNVLNPAHAGSPIPMSREASSRLKARQAYIQEHEPARYGAHMDHFEDSRLKEQVPQQTVQKYPKDPIMRPGMVTDHPSGRQNRILQQLSDLRRGLMQKQRELEIGLPTEEVAG